ncbi:MAG: 7-carboxy-7-deazaguanine synthase [Myxococcota bacterium]
MTYFVKELFYTIQGEGLQAGRPAVFCRFSGCNLWTGREQDRPTAACSFCDTDFVGTDGPGGGRFEHPEDLARTAAGFWAHGHAGSNPLIVCTGGEPLLQLDVALVEAFQRVGFDVAIESNGTIEAPDCIDWVCVSPKGTAPLRQTRGNELKLVFPQYGVDPQRFERLQFDALLLQPMDGPEIEKNTRLAVEYCLAHPQWRLSLQTHKFLGIP